MKIINAHVHLIELGKVMQEKDKLLPILNKIPSLKNIEQTMGMLSVETVLKQMEQANISKAVLFACYAPIIYSSNEFVASACDRYPDKFIGFASVQPKDWEAPVILEKAITELGLRGLKLHPPLQDVYPNDKILWQLYEKAMHLNIPVVIHVGSTPFGALAKLAQANPLLVDDVAVTFPKLKIILTHLGTMWQNEAFMVAEKNPNVYIDTAAYPHEIKNLLTPELVARVGVDKFIFGTDFPMPYEGKLHNMKDYVDCIESLDLSDEVKEKIFYKNFENLLNLPADS